MKKIIFTLFISALSLPFAFGTQEPTTGVDTQEELAMSHRRDNYKLSIKQKIALGGLGVGGATVGSLLLLGTLGSTFGEPVSTFTDPIFLALLHQVWHFQAPLEGPEFLFLHPYSINAGGC
jgi:hypothetical protein